MPAAARSSKLELVSLTYQLRDSRPPTLCAPIVLVLMMVWETNEKMSTKTHGTHCEGPPLLAVLLWAGYHLLAQSFLHEQRSTPIFP